MSKSSPRLDHYLVTLFMISCSSLNVPIPEILIPAFEVPSHRQLQQREVGSHQAQGSIGNEESVESGLTAEHYLQKGAVMSDISNMELTHCGSYTGEPKKRRIWRAGRHDWTKNVWVAVGTSS